MAKQYREIRFTYSGSTESLVIRTEWESVNRTELFSEFVSYSGKPYKQVTGSNQTYRYQFEYCDDGIYNIFNSAYEAGEVVFERELDDGTFESVTGYLSKPQFNDFTISETDKIYRDFTVTVRAK